GKKQGPCQAAGAGPHLIDCLAMERPWNARDAIEQLAVEQEILAERLGSAKAMAIDHITERWERQLPFGSDHQPCAARISAHSAASRIAAIIAPGSARP